MIDESSELWAYLSEGQQALIRQGFYLLEDAKSHTPLHPITDYSYLVFPFAKAYEGFLKQLFLDMKLIKKWQYESDHFRIGKALSPHLVKRLGTNSVYAGLIRFTGDSQLAENLWYVWKRGRNLIFHYFPHNTRAISLTEAEEINNQLLSAMTEAVSVYKKLKISN